MENTNNCQNLSNATSNFMKWMSIKQISVLYKYKKKTKRIITGCVLNQKIKSLSQTHRQRTRQHINRFYRYIKDKISIARSENKNTTEILNYINKQNKKNIHRVLLSNYRVYQWVGSTKKIENRGKNQTKK